MGLRISDLLAKALQIKQETVEEANSALRVGTLFEDIIRYVEMAISSIYDVTSEVPLPIGQYYTAATAREAVPASMRKLGLVISYNTTATQYTVEEFYKGDINDWANPVNWQNNTTEVLDAIAELQAKLNLEVVERATTVQALQNQLAGLVSGALGAIAHNAVAPTPGASGFYEFSTAGSCAWITGGAVTVKAGDRVSVKYTAPSTYVYTYIAVDFTRSGLYNVTARIPLPAGQFYTAATARAAVPTNVREPGLILNYATAIGVWVEEKFVGGDVSGWGTEGNWNASITNLQSQITTLQAGTYIETTDYWTQATINGYIGTTGADVGSDTNWRRSGFIPCTPGQKLKVRLYGHTAVNCISLYNSSNTYITGYKASSDGVLYENEITIPSGVAYFRISGGYDGWASSAATLPHYANLSSEKSIWDIISDFETQVDEAKSGTFTLLIDYWTQATINAYITKTGTVSIPDNNWRSTDFIECTPGNVLDVRLTGHTAVNNVSFYTGAYVFISGVGLTSGSLYANSVTVPENATYMRISGGSDTYGAADLPHYCKLNQSVELFTEIDRINAKLGNQLNIPLLSPWAVYTVCNNTIVSAKGRNRNYSQAVYIDHFFNGFTAEKDIRVKDGVDKLVFNAPMVVTDANETSPAVTYNGGVNVLEETKTFTLHGKDIVATNLSIKHRSVLNSVTANAHPKVLCIGDSITYAEQANIPDDGYTQNYAYHLICKELFMKDAIDNGNTGHNITFLGIYEKTKTFNYGGQNYNVKTHHEGIRGISLTQHLAGQVAQFKDDATGNWSLQAWLNKYRTLDDNGNRLTVGNGTGSLITSGNINSIDVCTPTHVIIMLGANGGGTLAQWQQMVSIIKTEFPNMIVGISIPDAAGTYFPSLHPNCNPLCTIWNDTGAQGSRHNQQYGLQSMLQAYWGDTTREAANEYILPFYYVAPTAESVALRDVHLPDSDIKLMGANKFYDNYGWHASTHVNGIGHTNWGYALYSWIKYTIAKNI